MSDTENIVGRQEAENIIKEAIDDYLDMETLQTILDAIHGAGEFMVMEDMELPDEDE